MVFKVSLLKFEFKLFLVLVQICLPILDGLIEFLKVILALKVFSSFLSCPLDERINIDPFKLSDQEMH